MCFCLAVEAIMIELESGEKNTRICAICTGWAAGKEEKGESICLHIIRR